MAGLTRLSRPRGVETRRWPCTVHMGDGCEVRHYKEEVLITLVLVFVTVRADEVQGTVYD